jgi:hypothetical protein
LHFGHIFLVPTRPLENDLARAAAIGLLLSLSQCSLLSLDSLNEADEAIEPPDAVAIEPPDAAIEPPDAAAMSPSDSGWPEDRTAPSEVDVAPQSVSDGAATLPVDAKARASDASAPTGAADAFVDAGGACDGTKPFGVPALLTSLVSSSREAGLHLLPDELSGFFWEGPLGATELFSTSRADHASAFGDVTLLKNVNAGVAQYDPSASGDGLSLVFRMNATGASNGDDLYWSSRTSLASDFSKGTPISDLDTSFSEVQPFLVPDGSSLYYASNAAGNYDIYRTQSAGNGSFAAPTPVAEINEAASVNQNPTVTADDLTMVFSSTRTGGQSGQDVWITTRPSRESSFAAPTNLAEVNSSSNDYPSWLSADGCRLYLYSDRSGTLHVYEATRPL